MREAANDTSGIPRIYVILDQSFEVFPKPDSDITLELTYFEEIPQLSINGTNWLLTYYPDAYLYGSLLHSASYLQEGNRIQEWGALYQSAISAINQDGERAKNGGSGRRIKIRSYG